MTELSCSTASPYEYRRALIRAYGWCLMTLGSLTAGRTWAEPLATPEVAVERAKWLDSRGRQEQARELLRRMALRYPSSELLAVARADAYLRDANPAWALKVLSEFSRDHPPACEARALWARVQIQQANLDDAEQVLEQSGCEQSEPARVRTLLLLAEIAMLRHDPASLRRRVLAADSLRDRYQEDDQELASLVSRYDPHRLPTLAWNLDLGGGWSSNGLAGAPVDRPAPRDTDGSPAVSLRFRARLVAQIAQSLRPVAEAELGLIQLSATQVRGLSTRQPVGRIGALLGRANPRLFVGYTYDLVHLASGSSESPGPGVYSEAHRAEYELEVSDTLMGFGGFGRRRFRESGRTRLEADYGLAKIFALSEPVRLTIGGLGRTYRAQHRVYDQVGATGFLGLVISLPKGELHETVSIAGDKYPASEGFWGTSAARWDTLVRAGAGWRSPESSWGLRWALDYEYTSRHSTAPGYDYDDHRALLHLIWRSDSDRLRVKRIGAQGRIPWRYHGNGTESEGPSRGKIQDRLRQDEAVRRGSSCLK
jgi:tetratricopeptide (TPR) repeat protein